MNFTIKVFDKILNEIDFLKLQKISFKVWEYDNPLPPFPSKPQPPSTYQIPKPQFKTGDFLLFLFLFACATYIFCLFLVPDMWWEITLIISSSLAFLLVLPSYITDSKRYRERIIERERENSTYRKKLIQYEQEKKNYPDLFKKTVEKWKTHPGYFTEEENNTKIETLLKQLYSNKEILVNHQIEKFNGYLRDHPISEIKPLPLKNNGVKNSKNLGENFSPAQKRNVVDSLDSKKRSELYILLQKVNKIQNSKISSNEKAREIKRILWTEQTASKKLWIGGVLGSLTGLAVFGTGGIGIAALGGGIGVWGFLAGTTGGVLVSSLIQNYEKSATKKN